MFTFNPGEYFRIIARAYFAKLSWFAQFQRSDIQPIDHYVYHSGQISFTNESTHNGWHMPGLLGREGFELLFFRIPHYINHLRDVPKEIWPSFFFIFLAVPGWNLIVLLIPRLLRMLLHSRFPQNFPLLVIHPDQVLKSPVLYRLVDLNPPHR